MTMCTPFRRLSRALPLLWATALVACGGGDHGRCQRSRRQVRGQLVQRLH